MDNYTINKPYISIVIAGRNDNYGGDFDMRLNNSLKWYYGIFEKAKLYTEIVLVNYNPILDSAPLSERIEGAKHLKYVQLRIITVDENAHNGYHNEAKRKKLPFYEFIAKNIGIRRAKGQYILSTNADIIIPETVLSHVTQQNLSPYHYYRTSRADFYKFDSTDYSSDKLIAACEQNTFKIFLKGFTYDINGKRFAFELLRLKIYNFIRLKYNLLKAAFPERMNRWSIPFISHNAEFKYHCQGSGDFMLMHRNNWIKLRGNPENTMVSTHADSWIVIIAAASGLTEKVFYTPVFHQHHERRFGWDDMNSNPFFRSEYERFETAALSMLAAKKPIIENSDDWGCGETKFEEQIL